MMERERQYGRGPDPTELALDSFKRELLNFQTLGAKFVRAADDLIRAEEAMLRVAGVGARLSLDRELSAVLAMRRGEPFWDRPPPEPIVRRRVPVEIEDART